ncbi:MAG: hypothetical protein H0V29_06765 [Thermoleophilaceae bacterium]|nr:hypothetical protein [Thermoleophilaceae bacterium]
MTPHIYEHCDIPEGQTIAEYRREREAAKSAKRRKRARRAIARRLRRR